METETEKRYGWYSAEAAKFYGSSTYKTPDQKLVEVTCVGKNADGYLWPDKVFVGEVTESVGRNPATEDMHNFKMMPFQDPVRARKTWPFKHWTK